MPRLSLTFLGAFQVVLDGKPVTAFRSNKVAGLLAYLACTLDQPAAREALAALFWPDEPEATARQNLRQSLYQLRQILGETTSPAESFLLISRTTVHRATTMRIRQLQPCGPLVWATSPPKRTCTRSRGASMNALAFGMSWPWG